MLSVLFILVLLLVVRFFSAEDTRICDDGKWIPHGHPSSAQPLTGCLLASWVVDSEQQELFTVSSVFESGEMIPSSYTCQGKDVQPSFAFAGIPKGTKSLALIIDDPDAPRWIWTHWVVWNIPVMSGLQENVVPTWAVQGKNSWWTLPYRGPCPPSGIHRYFFTVYALDADLSLSAWSSRQQFEEAIQGHVLEETELMWRYQKK